MKKIFLAFALSIATFSSYANETPSVREALVCLDEEEKKVEIEIAKLPASVAEAIQKTHKDASITKAYQLEKADKTVTGYEVIVKSGEKEETLKFDAAGTIVK